MPMKITRENMQALKDAADRFTEAYGSIEDAIDTWLEFQDSPPTDADGREERKGAREEIDGGIEEIGDAIADLAALSR